MTVSLVVGTLPTLAEYTQEPAVLRGAQPSRPARDAAIGTFATCLVLRIRPDGRATVTAADTPRGLSPRPRNRCTWRAAARRLEHAEYEMSSFALRDAGDVNPADGRCRRSRDRGGELYGFERTADLLAACSNPSEIVESVCSLGRKTISRSFPSPSSRSAYRSKPRPSICFPPNSSFYSAKAAHAVGSSE